MTIKYPKYMPWELRPAWESFKRGETEGEALYYEARHIADWIVGPEREEKWEAYGKARRACQEEVDAIFQKALERRGLAEHPWAGVEDRSRRQEIADENRCCDRWEEVMEEVSDAVAEIRATHKPAIDEARAEYEEAKRRATVASDGIMTEVGAARQRVFSRFCRVFLDTSSDFWSRRHANMARRGA